jgi:pyruvate dehydrogenase E1 component alpha subunit
MTKKSEQAFTPTGFVYKSTILPEATKKDHKKLGLTNDDVIALFREMFLQRRFEERAAQMYQKGKFGGFLHLYIGQEAISSGTNFVLQPDDDIITAYRDHGFGLVRGISAKAGMAELFGKATGCSSGKGGSMHFFNAEQHFWGGHGIVGAHIPVGAGMAFANKYLGNGRVSICFFGDGAVDQGALHEAFNLAQLWKLPVIFVVENNGYSMGTAVQRHTATEIYKRAHAYDMANGIVNGMDLFSIIDKMQEISTYVRENSLPYFLEIRTYRYKGHSMSDPGNYRTKEELDEFRQIDPIERLKTYMLDKKLITQKAMDSIMDEVNQEVMDSIDFAEESPFPEPSELYQHVFSGEGNILHDTKY